MADVTAIARVVHSLSQERYEAFLDDELVGFLDYQPRDDQVVITHTVVFDRHAHHGIGAQLVRHVLDDVAQSGRKVVPVCSFVQRFIADNPAYAAMVVDA
ncbi:GNAT family N-acetyltransferase [Williamsia sp. SKLECPSW1]